MTYRLYGMPASLYTAKARSYLLTQGVAFKERTPGEAHFREHIVPKLGRWIIPVLEGPDGALVQDGSDIIAHLQSRGETRFSVYPATPRHAVIAQIFELFGGEGLLRPTMHFRWNFEAENRAFLAQDFPAALTPPGSPADVRAAVFEQAAQRMRKAMASFGVNAATIPAVEASYGEFLRLFDAHLEGAPYLLGGRATIGDYALIGPLGAHLGRDPYPAALMQQTAPRVWRWRERMHRPDRDAGEYGDAPEALFAEDGVPDTLKALLRFVAEDYLPEVQAHVAFCNAWLAERPDLAPGSSGLERTQERRIGQTAFAWRGQELRVGAMPYRLYLLQKVQDGADHAPPEAEVSALLEEVGLGDLLTLRTSRRIVRRNHLEVWA